MHPTDLTLNDYVDDLLTQAQRGSVDDHLRDCQQCRGLIADFREIRQSATGLGPIEPSARVWMRVEQALRSTAVETGADTASRDGLPRGRWSRLLGRRGSRSGSGGFGLLINGRQLGRAVLVAAALVAAIFVGVRIGRQQQPDTTATGSDSVPSAQSIEAELQQAEEHYQKAIAGLEQIASANSGVFDPATAATLQKNLLVVDQAISDSRAALRAQPNSEPAQASLLDSFKAKLALLQDTVSLINEMRKGDDAAAARIVSSLKRGA